MIVTVDLDSTLCDTGHRQPMIDRENGTDWTAYSLACADDTPILATVQLIKLLSSTHRIHALSARAQTANALTRAWLTRHSVPIERLWMNDTPGNREFIDAYGSHEGYKLTRIREIEEVTGEKVALHIDDWAGVKILLERNGYPCLCVRTPQELEVFEGVLA